MCDRVKAIGTLLLLCCFTFAAALLTAGEVQLVYPLQEARAGAAFSNKGGQRTPVLTPGGLRLDLSGMAERWCSFAFSPTERLGGSYMYLPHFRKGKIKGAIRLEGDGSPIPPKCYLRLRDHEGEIFEFTIGPLQVGRNTFEIALDAAKPVQPTNFGKKGDKKYSHPLAPDNIGFHIPKGVKQEFFILEKLVFEEENPDFETAADVDYSYGTGRAGEKFLTSPDGGKFLAADNNQCLLSGGAPMFETTRAVCAQEIYLPQAGKVRAIELLFKRTRDKETRRLVFEIPREWQGRQTASFEIPPDLAYRKIFWWLERRDTRLLGYRVIPSTPGETPEIGFGFGKVRYPQLTCSFLTGNDINCLYPGAEKCLAMQITNTGKKPFHGTLKFSEEGGAWQKVTLDLYPGAYKIVPLTAPKKYGVRHFRTEEKSADFAAPFRHTASYAYMDPTGESPYNPKPTFRFGVSGAAGYDKQEAIDREIRFIAAAGIKNMRMGQPLLHQRYLNGTVFAPLEDALRTLEAHGMAGEQIMYGCPWEMRDKNWKPYLKNGTGSPKPDIAKWKEYIEINTRTYKGRVFAYEIWNEPDMDSMINFSGEDYAEIVNAACDAAHKVNPEIRVATGGFAIVPHPDQKTFSIHITDPWILPKTMKLCNGHYDMFGIHIHGDMISYRRSVKLLRDYMKKYGVKVPWYANETGISALLVGEDVQARVLFQKILYSWANGSCGYIWYNIRNNGFDANENEHNFGLCTFDFFPKKAYVAYNTVTKNFSEGKFEKEFSFGSGVEAFQFTQKGEVIVAYWYLTRKGERLSVLSGIKGKTATLIDICGNQKVLPVVDGKVIVPVSEEPQLVRLAGGSAPKYEGDALFPELPNGIAGARNTFGAELKNFGSKPLAVSLHCSANASMKLPKKNHAFSLQPGQTAKCGIAVDLPKDFKQGTLLLTANMGDFGSYEVSFPIQAVVQLGRGEKTPDFVLNRSAQVTPLVTNLPENSPLFWAGPRDLSAEVFFRKDATNLYIDVIVTDDVHKQENEGQFIWLGDSVQLGLLFSWQMNFWEIGLARLADGKPCLWFWNTPPFYDQTKLRAAMKLTVDRDEAAHKTIYKLRIPFGSIVFDPKRTFRMNLLINDNDGKVRESYIQIAPGLGNIKDTTQWVEARF